MRGTPRASILPTADLDVIEQKFDYENVTAPPLERIRELQQRVRRMEGTVVGQDLTLLPALADVMTVRAGTVCSVDTPGLALALAAGASQAGSWVGFAGLPEVGWEAAADLGIDLDRTVAVPFPGEHWLSVTAALVEVIGVVIARPPGPVSEAQAGRVSARLRQRGAVLIVEGSWPRAALRVTTVANDWTGLGSGHGHLHHREVRLEIRTQTDTPQRVTLGLRPNLVTVVPTTVPASLSSTVATDDLSAVAAMAG